MASKQDELPTGVDNTEQSSDTVYVVSSRKEDSPHPFVEAVYDNEGAAMEHKRDLGSNSFQHGVVAWGMDARTVQSEYCEGTEPGGDHGDD